MIQSYLTRAVSSRSCKTSKTLSRASSSNTCLPLGLYRYWMKPGTAVRATALIPRAGYMCDDNLHGPCVIGVQQIVDSSFPHCNGSLAMHTTIYLLCLVADFAFAASATPSRQPIIIDTDLFGDVDDAGALAVANILHYCGLADLRGVAINTHSKYGAPAASVCLPVSCRQAVADLLRTGHLLISRSVLFAP